MSEQGHPLSRRTMLGAAVAVPMAAQFASRAHAASPELLGIPLTQKRVAASLAGQWTDDRPVMYLIGGSPGEDVQFAVLDMETGQQIASHPITEINDALTVVQAPDGKVYIPGWGATALLLEYDPATDTMTNLGIAVEGESHITRLDVAPNGALVGGTYPNAHVFAYHPNSKVFVDHGRVHPTQQYARSVAHDRNGGVYIGTEGEAHVLHLDLSTDEVSEIALPPDMEPDDYRVSLLAWRNDKLFAFFTGSHDWHVYDPATTTWNVRIPGQHAPSMPTMPDSDNLIYFPHSGLDTLIVYDLSDDTWVESTWDEPMTYSLGGAGLTLIDLPLPGYGEDTVAGMSRDGSLWYWNRHTGNGIVRTDVESTTTDIVIRAIGVGPDDNIYVGMSFSNGALHCHDPSTGEGTLLTGGPTSQVHKFEASELKLYLGTYSNAVLLEYDPGQPYDFGTNPREILELGSRQQDRLFGLEDLGDRLAVGSWGKRGQGTGRLVFVNYASDEVVDHGEILPGHQIIALVHQDSMLFGGTSISTPGGDPTEPEALVFAWDLTSDSVAWHVPPIAGESSISELIMAPDGMIWGITGEHRLFHFDPATRKTLGVIEPVGNGGISGRPRLHYGPDGTLYGSTGNGVVFRVDQGNYTRSTLTTGANLALDADGGLYFSRGAELWKLVP